MKISVVIPAYNAERTISRALDSVLAQTRSADEIIVVDDGSTDATAEKVRAYGDRVRLIQQGNAGVSVARNTGIEAAAGDWIAFLDSDDEWLADKLKQQIQHLQQYPDLKWLYSNFYCKASDGEQMQPAHVSRQLTEFLVDGAFDDYLHIYTHHGYAWTSVLMIHKQVFEKTGLFEPGMKRAQDNDLWFRVAYQFPKIGYCPEPLAVYHLDTPNSSTKINDNVDFMIDLVARHEELSKRYQRFEAFGPCITRMVENWTRQLLGQHRSKDAKQLFMKFRSYLSSRFCREIRFRLCCPPVTNRIADAVLSLKKIARGGTG